MDVPFFASCGTGNERLDAVLQVAAVAGFRYGPFARCVVPYSSIPMLDSTLSGVVIEGGIAVAV